MVTLSEYRNIFRSKRSSVRRSSQFFPALLMCAVLVLGPLAIVAYACGYGGGGNGGQAVSHGGGKGGGKGNGGWGGGHGGGSGGNNNGGGTPSVPPSPGSGGGTPLPGGSDGGSGGGSGDGSGSGGGTPSTPPANPGADGGAGSGGDSGTPSGSGSTPPPSTSTPTPEESKPAAPSGGVVKDEKSGSNGKKQTSRSKSDKSNGSKGSGSGGNTGSRAGSAVASIAATARPSAGPGLAIVAPSNGSDKSSRSSGAKPSNSGSNDKKASESPRKQTTIARAVDGIPLAFRAALLLLIFATSILAVVSFRERRRATAVARVAQLDHLTGLSNREGFDRQMAIEWQRALRHGRPLGMVFVDLDHFKSYNDTYGHVAGDRLLREVAAAITATARGSDFTARLGGDEFVVVCPDTDQAGLDRLVERLRVEASGMSVSLSIGAAAKLPGDTSPDELTHRADVAMYAAKGGSRRDVKSANPMLGSLRRG